MKKLLFIGAIALSLISCSKNDPASVAKNFIQSLSEGKMDDLKKYSDKEIYTLILTFYSMAENDEEMKKKLLKKEKGDIEIIKVDEKGDKAVVYYKMKGEKSDQQSSLDLKKIDGEWKVSMGKEGKKKEEFNKSGASDEKNSTHETSETVESKQTDFASVK